MNVDGKNEFREEGKRVRVIYSFGTSGKLRNAGFRGNEEGGADVPEGWCVAMKW